jgi:hypothetical protein
MAAFHGVTGTKVLALNGHWELLGFGHCEAGVWNTGWCCMALPTLYYFTVLSPRLLVRVYLNLVAQRAGGGRRWSIFIHRFAIFTIISLFVVLGYQQP